MKAKGAVTCCLMVRYQLKLYEVKNGLDLVWKLDRSLFSSSSSLGFPHLSPCRHTRNPVSRVCFAVLIILGIAESIDECTSPIIDAFCFTVTHNQYITLVWEGPEHRSIHHDRLQERVGSCAEPANRVPSFVRREGKWGRKCTVEQKEVKFRVHNASTDMGLKKDSTIRIFFSRNLVLCAAVVPSAGATPLAWKWKARRRLPHHC